MAMSDEVSRRLKGAVRDASSIGIMGGETTQIWDMVRELLGKSYADADDSDALRAIEKIEEMISMVEV
jgi:hypothetical protein